MNTNEISDLGLAASLSASGFAIARIDKSNPRRVVFVFDDTEALRQKVSEYWANELLLPAAVLLSHVRLLKARIYG
jgi:hypothetical protein